MRRGPRIFYTALALQFQRQADASHAPRAAHFLHRTGAIGAGAFDLGREFQPLVV